jgi:hypothetical protein
LKLKMQEYQALEAEINMLRADAIKNTRQSEVVHP